LITGGKGEICVFDAALVSSNWPISAEVLAYDDWHRQYSQASFSHDTKWLATRNRDFTASLRSPRTLEELIHLSDLGTNVRGVRFSPVDNSLAVGDSDGYLSFIDPESPADIARVKLVESGRVSPVGFSADGTRLLLVVQEERQARYIIWSVRDSRKLEVWTIPGMDKCAAISPDGETVVTGHVDGTARIWKVSDPTEARDVAFNAPTYSLAFAPDGRHFAVGNTAVHLVDVMSGKVVTSMLGHSHTIHSIGFSPDGHRIATGGGVEDEAVKIWDISTKHELMTLTAEGFSFRQVEFSPDGNSVMAIGGNHFLKMWHVPTLDEIDAQLDSSRQ